MATVYIDNKPYPVNPQENLLHQCLSLGFNLPYFCWHPALGSVGACRQCAVKHFKDEHDTQGKIVMACVTAAVDGTRISIDDPEAASFRAGVIEGLMLNHPHDCPVCDEGGECHLQDMTVMTGLAHRRYRFEKRTFRNQDLGPLVNHEMNRCIQCYRCVRFYRDYAGGKDLNSFSLHDTVFFGRERDGVLESEFAGNLVEVCPTGVFTDKTLKQHYTRKWDQLFAPSVCVHCGTGCNTSVGERYGTVRRTVNRYNHEVNGYFLCDRGRFGYEFVNSERRIREPRLRGEPAAPETAIEHLRRAVAHGGAVGIGSPRASLESNFALRSLVGAGRFFCGIADGEASLIRLMLDILRTKPVRVPTLQEIELSDAVLVLGEDVANTAPRIALSLRQSVRQSSFDIANKLKIPLWLDNGVRDAAQDRRSPLFVLATQATRIDEIATETFRAAPDDLARVGFEIGKSVIGPDSGAGGIGCDLVNEISTALKNAKRPLVISGSSCGSAAVIQAAANIAQAYGAALYYTLPECNTIGAALMGGGSLTSAFDLIRNGYADTLIVLENDLYRRAPRAEVDPLLEKVPHLIVLDSLVNDTSAKAELLLPAATFAESDGTFVS
ncbi:MAG: NADH-quinone oxidoreductase subunit NuoG, partial [Bryobacterales bacterium]|nr:NADH-quinone oxidoreductase subunit NuoG [Bryobacterales bacterium]